MFKHRTAILMIVVSVAPWGLSPARAETWRLAEQKDWKSLSDETQDAFLHRVAAIKQFVESGQCKTLASAIKKLRQDFPLIAASDFDGFIKAEMLFCRGKLTKAVRQYNKFLDGYPESELYQAALERLFAIGNAFLSGEKRRVLGIFRITGYAEGVSIMEKLSDRAGDSPIAVDAAVRVARSYETRGRYEDAYFKWSEISSRWPTGQTGKDALLAMARCKHTGYKGPRYDASNLVSAKTYYEQFEVRYPDEAVEIGASERLGQIHEQLAFKQFSIGRYYQATGSTQSAHLYYQMVIDNWPDSTAAKRAKQAMQGG